MIGDHVIFTSSHFAIEPGEDAETNPGVYGKALAEWMSEKLRGRGVPTEEVFAEDFGWCVMVKRKPFMLWIACSSLEATRWQMLIAVEINPIRRLFSRIDPAPDLTRLREHFRAIVQEVPGVTGIEWQPESPR